MLSGTAPDGPTVDKAVLIAKQFGPDIINSVRCCQPQQVMLEVRFVEATRKAGRDLGVQWNVFGQRTLANIGNRNTNSGGSIFIAGPMARKVDWRRIRRSIAGVLSGTAPLGVLVSNFAPPESRPTWHQRA